MNDEKKLPPGWGQQTSSQPVWNNIKNNTQSDNLAVIDTDTPKQEDSVSASLVEDKKTQENIGKPFEVEESKAIVKEPFSVEELKEIVEEFAEVEESKTLAEQIVKVEEKSKSTTENQKSNKKQTRKKGNILVIVLVAIIILLLGIIGLGVGLKGDVLKEAFEDKKDNTTNTSDTKTESINKENAKADHKAQAENNSEKKSDSETEDNDEKESNSDVQSNSEIASNSTTENNSQTGSNSNAGNKAETDNDASVDNGLNTEENTTPSAGNSPSGSIVYETSVDWSQYVGTWSASSVVHTHGNTTCYDVSLNLKLYEDGDIYYNMKMCNGYSQHTTSKGFLYADGDGTYSGTSLDSVYKVEIGVFQGGIHFIITNSYNIWDCADAYLTLKID